MNNGTSKHISTTINIQNTEQELLSIIVTVYNVEKYIYKCINSLLTQTLDKRLFEVIIVDDCSTDDSLKICQQFEDTFPHFRIISLPANTPGGTGIPANTGIRAARGRYIGFLDGDDYAYSTMFERLLHAALECEADIALCSFDVFDDATQTVRPAHDAARFARLAEEGFQGLSDVAKKMRYLALNPVPWRKIYSRDFLLKNAVFFPEGDFFFEDIVLHWKAVLLAEKIVHVNEPLAAHRMNRAGQTNTAPAEKFFPTAEHVKSVYDLLRRTGAYEDYRFEYCRFVVRLLEWTLPRFSATQQDAFRSMLRPHIPRLSLSEFKAYAGWHKIRLRRAFRHYLHLRDWYRPNTQSARILRRLGI